MSPGFRCWLKLGQVRILVVLSHAAALAWLAAATFTVVLADARPAALLAPASSAVLLTDARAAQLLAFAFYAVVLIRSRGRLDDLPSYLFLKLDSSCTSIRDA